MKFAVLVGQLLPVVYASTTFINPPPRIGDGDALPVYKIGDTLPVQWKTTSTDIRLVLFQVHPDGSHDGIKLLDNSKDKTYQWKVGYNDSAPTTLVDSQFYFRVYEDGGGDGGRSLYFVLKSTKPQEQSSSSSSTVQGQASSVSSTVKQGDDAKTNTQSTTESTTASALSSASSSVPQGSSQPTASQAIPSTTAAGETSDAASPSTASHAAAETASDESPAATAAIEGTHSNKNDQSLSGGTIAGIAVGAAAVVLSMIALCFICVRKRQQRKRAVNSGDCENDFKLRPRSSHDKDDAIQLVSRETDQERDLDARSFSSQTTDIGSTAISTLPMARTQTPTPQKDKSGPANNSVFNVHVHVRTESPQPVQAVESPNTHMDPLVSGPGSSSTLDKHIDSTGHAGAAPSTRSSRGPQQVNGSQNTAGEVEFAIICALNVESTGIGYFLEEVEKAERPRKLPNDPISYTHGKLGGRRVVLVHLGHIGSHSASQAAGWCTTSFPTIRFLIVVGVCGAVPVSSLKKELVLGDVIIATRVTQTDSGKQLDTGFVPTTRISEQLGRPTTLVSSKVEQLRMEQMHDKIRQRMISLVQGLAAAGKESAIHPGPELDKLYGAEQIHKDATELCSNICRGGTIKRKRLAPGAPDPEIHFGVFGSGNQVIRSAEFRDQLFKNHEVLGVEMESAGIWDKYPCFVVKGACDYADGHKTKTFQPYSAITAAATVTAMLENWGD